MKFSKNKLKTLKVSKKGTTQGFKYYQLVLFFNLISIMIWTDMNLNFNFRFKSKY